MAAIGHTLMVFKNGVWLEDQDHFNADGEFVNHCPFLYGRDGNIHTIDNVCKENER